jgi:O-succinylbenzoate synthase
VAACDLMRTVEYQFSLRPYRLPFRAPVRTSHGVWSERTGVIVRLEDENGRVGFGEAAPIPWFGTETVEEIVAACGSLGERVDERRLDDLPVALRCLKNALVAARTESVTPQNPAPRQVAALLPAGTPALPALRGRLEAGFRVFKWKVGVGDVADELAILDDLCGELPSGGRLRLDANGAWDRRTAERWLARCAERPVEFVEQPCFAPGTGASQGAALRQRVEDLLMGLAGDFPTPIALDESVVADGDVDRWLGRGWPGVIVLKPTLLADMDGTMAKLAKASTPLVFSSALETGVGAKQALSLAFAWSGPSLALGFGVWPLFDRPECEGPTAAPFVRWEDVQAINPEAVWNALS